MFAEALVSCHELAPHLFSDCDCFGRGGLFACYDTGTGRSFNL